MVEFEDEIKDKAVRQKVPSASVIKILFMSGK
jgi:hypothetical protein